jgi:hypothetical protein
MWLSTRCEERNTGQNVVVHQKWSADDMPSEQHPEKSKSTASKPARDRRSPSPQHPQIRSPLLNDGLELLHDSRC